MKLVITTQYKENYGDEDQPHWKFKGGSVYVVENLTVEQAQRGQANHPRLAELIEHRNSMSEESIVGVTIVQDQYDVCEPWETVQVLTSHGREWYARETIDNGRYGYMHPEIRRCIKSWRMLPQGERAEYSVTYVLHDGRTAHSDLEFNELLKRAA